MILLWAVCEGKREDCEGNQKYIKWIEYIYHVWAFDHKK